MNILWISIAVFIALLMLGYRLSANAGRKASKTFQALEQKYIGFVERYLAMQIINSPDTALDKDGLAKEILVLLKPEIDGLIAQINSTELSDVKIKYPTNYFQNALNFCEQMFQERNNTKATISEKYEEEFYKYFQDAIKADLTRRLLEIQAGRF